MDKLLLQEILGTPSELCVVAPYSGILQSYDIDVDDTSLYCNCGGLDFRYGYIHDYKWNRRYICEMDTISLEGSRDIKNALYEQLGICFKEVLCADKGLAIDLIMNQLSDGKKVICFGDVYFLTYHPQYHKSHGQTTLTIWDYNSTTGNFSVSDRHVTTIPISSYYGPLSMADFERALVCGDNAFDGKETGIIIYDAFDGEKAVFKEPEKKIVEMAQRMLANNDVLTGVNGIKTFGNDVINWKSQWDNKRIKSVYNSAYQHIMGRVGPYISRKVYADYVTQQYKDSELGNLFSDVAGKWHSLSVKFFRNTIDIGKNSLESISALIGEIAEEENEIYELIIDKYGKHYNKRD
ncbi:MAG: BtrH N-terminal domain-containing protein [Lachnospiraceae bacterium]|nr:BtrH N-terminal domain-containing protein [Lachnospiraceae bacterium]